MKNTRNCEVCLNFFTKTCLTNNYLSRDPHFVILAWVQRWNIFEKLMKLWNPLEFFHKNMSHKQLLFTWSTFRDCSMGTQSWNIYEKHMKLWSSPEFFHKNTSHQQLPFMWCTLRDSSMCTKLKSFWKTHETVKSILLAIHLTSFVLMSRQWWPKCIDSVTVTVSVFIPVLNALVRL